MGQFLLNYLGDSYQLGATVYGSSGAAITASKLTYTRAATAAYQPAAGGVTKFAANTLRRGDRGALVEQSVKNACWATEDGTIANWSKARMGATAGGAGAPDGTSTVTILSDQTLSNGHVFQNRNGVQPVVAGVVYCMSAFLKSAGSGATQGRYVTIGFQTTQFGAGGTTQCGICVDLTTGLVTEVFPQPLVGYGVIDCGGGWYRIWCSAKCLTGTFSSGCQIGSSITATPGTLFPVYLGANRLWWFWGGAFDNAESALSSYIPVTGTADITRGDDVITWTLPTVSGGRYDVRYTFDDNTTLDVLGVSSTYVTPLFLPKSYIKSVADITAYATPAKVRGASVWSPATANPTITISGAAAGNLLVAHIVSSGYLSADPTGWTLLSSDGNTANAGSRVYARIATGTSADNIVYTMAGAYNSTVTWTEWSGVDTLTSVALAQGGMTVPSYLQDNPGDNTITSPVIAPIPVGCLVIAFEGAAGNTSFDWSVAPTVSNSFTVAQYAGQNAPGGSGAGIDNLASTQASRIITGDNATTYGTVFTLTGTYPGVTAAGFTHIVAFRPKPAGTVSPLSAVLAKTDAPDTLATTVTAGNNGAVATLTKTDLPDALVATAAVAEQAVLTGADGPDTLVATVELTELGPQAALDATDLADTLDATAMAQDQVHADLVATDLPDTVVTTAMVDLTAALSGTDLVDTLAATAVVQNPIFAALTKTDLADTLVATAAVEEQALLAGTDGPDTLVTTAKVDTQVVLAATDAPDILSTLVKVGLLAALAGTDGPDALVATVAVPLNATLTKTDLADTLAATSMVQNQVHADLTKTDLPDTLSAQARVDLHATLSKTDAVDTLVATAKIGLAQIFVQNYRPNSKRHAAAAAIQVPTQDPRSLQTSVEQMKSIVEVMQGTRGKDETKASVTYEDLVRLGIITSEDVP